MMFSFVELPRINPASTVPCTCVVGASDYGVYGSEQPDDPHLEHCRSRMVLGIEVTSPEQLALCALGNVDGQHRTGESLTYSTAYMGGSRVHWTGRAACDIATEIPLPPDGTCLATTRADLDSVATMAVLMLRRLALDVVRYDAWMRLRLIAERDSFPAEHWQPCPLPTPEQPWPIGMACVSDTRELAHVASICSPRPGEPALPMAERVAVVACWLLWGDPPQDVHTGTAGTRWGESSAAAPLLDECGVRGTTTADIAATIHAARRRVEASRLALAEEARRPGALEARWSDGRWCDVSEVPDECGDTEEDGPHACIVRVAHAGALGLGYCVAPVVIAFDWALAGKVTIAAWGERYLDVPRLRARLNELERVARGHMSSVPGWGGPPVMCCSPQVDGGTRLSEETIVREALACARAS